MKKVVLLASALIVMGCTSSDKTDLAGFDARMVLAATDPGYTTSNVIFIGDTDNDIDVVVGDDPDEEVDVATTDTTDIVISVDGDDVYRLARDLSSITRVYFDTEDQELKLDENFDISVTASDGLGNPYQFLKTDSETAYVALYDSQFLLKLDLSLDSEDSDFLTEIDLSDFAIGDELTPYATDLALVNGELFVLLQRGDAYTCFSIYTCYNYDDNSYLVVIDPVSGAIVEPGNSSNLYVSGSSDIEEFSIDLGIRNAVGLDAVSGLLFAHSWDGYDSSYNYYNGGVVRVGWVEDEISDTESENDYYVTELLNLGTVGTDTDGNSIPGSFSQITFVTSDEFYFSSWDGSTWGDHSVYHYTKVSDGDDDYDADDYGIEAVSLDDAGDTYLVTSLGYDSFFNEVYVGVGAASDEDDAEVGLMVIDRDSDENAVDESKFIDTVYNPTQIEVF